jgi:GNAT superfamily N-acetyltransferase
VPVTHFIIRAAGLLEVPALEALIARSARELGRAHYPDDVLDRAIGTAFGVDSDLVRDGTYLVADAEGVIAGCGGWSRRATLFGADAFSGHDSALLDPARDPAKIRAFFVHPEWTRRGIGRAIYDRCETEARAAGFRSLELMATLGGVPLYRELGFVPAAPIRHDLGGGLDIEFVPMRKELTA